MAKYAVNGENLAAVADAIREKGGTEDPLLFPEGFVQAVEQLKTKPDLQDKAVTPGADDQNVTADSGYDGLGAVTVVGDADLIAANIKRGVDIFGVTGNYNGPASSGSTIDTIYMTINGTDYSVDGMPQTGLYHKRTLIGTTVGLEYTGAGRFLHWVAAPDGKVRGDGAKACSVTLTANTTYNPVVLNDALPGEGAPYYAYVEFMSEYSQVMDAGTWSSADNAQQHTLPPVPFKIGSNGLGWTLDGETTCTVQDIINSIDGSSAYKEIRALYEAVVVPVTITVVNNIDDSVSVLQSARDKNARLTEEVKAGYRVAWWSMDREGKEKLGRSYNSSQKLAYCYMVPSHDTTVYVHYVPDTVETPLLSGIAITGMYSAKLDDGLYILASVTRNISSKETVKVNGMLTAYGGDVQEETAEQTMVLGSGSVTVSAGTSTSRAGVYTSRELVGTEDTVLWVRGYCTVSDSTGVERTIYTAVRNYTYAELMSADTFPI